MGWQGKWVAAVCVLACKAVLAGHPLSTEDTGTQGAGNIELENGLSRSRMAGAESLMYQPQFSLGVTPSLDLIVQPGWIRQCDSDGPCMVGRGDTNIDAKWRFAADGPWSLGVRAGWTVATSQNGLGFPSDSPGTHAVLVATFDAAPYMVHINTGLIQNPAAPGQRDRIWMASLAGTWSVNERWTLVAESGVASHPDAAQSSVSVSSLLGVVYTLRPSIDIDLGYQTNRNAPQDGNQWLVGLTYRFAWPN